MLTKLPAVMLAFLVALTPFATRPAVAQVIAYDPFNQATGQLNGSASTGVPWPVAATWQPAFGNGGLVVASGLTYGPLAVAGGTSQFAWFTGNNGSVRSLGSNRGGAPADFWISFLATFTQPSQGLYLYSGTQPQMLVGAPAAGGLGLELYGPVTGGANQALPVVPAVAVNGATHFFAAHFQLGSAGATNVITLTVDPNVASLGAGAAPTGGSTVMFATAQNFAFDNVVVSNFSGVTGAAGTFTLDEIRLGSTWASVSPVPEPASWLLLASALIAWQVRRGRGPCHDR